MPCLTSKNGGRPPPLNLLLELFAAWFFLKSWKINARVCINQLTTGLQYSTNQQKCKVRWSEISK
jgi:hypothetical protein